MKRIQKILIVVGMLTVLLFAFSGEQKAASISSDSNDTSFLSDDYLHSPACLQPQVTSVLGATFQSADYAIVKLSETFLLSTTVFKVLHPASHFISQDSGRFGKVAVLLYPFHFFW